MTEEATRLFDAVAEAVEHDPSTGKERGFGSSGLKAGGKLFAMLVRGELVVKLPRDRVEQLVGEGSGVPFDPGHGRLMREWIAVPVGDQDRWIGLAQEARAFVAPVTKPSPPDRRGAR